MRNKQGAELESVLENILKSNTKNCSRNSKRIVTLNEHFTVNEIQFEIDVVTRTKTQDGSEEIELYECKDWKDPVGPKEVSWLKDKVDLLKAKHGYLVASKFSKSTVAYCKRFDSVSLQRLSKDKLTNTNAEIKVFSATAAWSPLTIHALWKDKTSNPSSTFNPENCSFSISGKPTNLVSYLESQLDDIYKETVQEEKGRLSLGGFHSIPINVEITEPTKRLYLDGHELRALYLSTTLLYEPAECKLTQVWDIEKAGWKTVFAPNYASYQAEVKIEVFGSKSSIKNLPAK